MTNRRSPALHASSGPAASTDEAPKADSPHKLAEKVARDLELQIVEAGWPVGKSLGSEEQLIERFGVSRWVLREALALTENDGMTQRRRGRGGGLIVSAPAEDVVVAGLRNYLLHARPRGAHLREAIFALDRDAFWLAAVRRTPQAVQPIRELLAAPQASDAWEIHRRSLQVYRHLLRMAGNPLLETFAMTLGQLYFARGVLSGATWLTGPGSLGLAREIVGIRRRQVEAVLAGDPAMAIELGTELSQIWDSASAGSGRSRRDTRRPILPSDAAERIAEQIASLNGEKRNVRRSDTLAFQLHHWILVGALQPGDRLGSESELCARFGVGREVLRETIRSLERHGFVEVGEGRNGGLRVCRPSSRAITRSSVLYLRHTQPSLSDVTWFLHLVYKRIVDQVARRVRAEGSGVLQAVRAAAEGVDRTPGRLDLGSLGSFFDELAVASGNPVLALFASIPSKVITVRALALGSRPTEEQRARMLAGLRRLIDGLSQGDPLLARQGVDELHAAAEAMDLQPEGIEQILFNT